MINKILGAAIIIGVICGIIFAFKYIPVYTANADLQAAFQDCIANWDGYKMGGCGANFEKIIKENNLNLDPAAIRVEVELSQPSIVEAEYIQTVDFFGFWKYVVTFHPIAKGTPQKRT